MGRHLCPRLPFDTGQRLNGLRGLQRGPIQADTLVRDAGRVLDTPNSRPVGALSLVRGELHVTNHHTDPGTPWGAKMFIAKRKGNIHVDVRARGRAKRSAPRKAAGYTRVAPKSTKLLRHPNRQWHADTRAHRHSGTQTLAHDGTHGTVARRHSHTTAPTAQWHVDTRTQRHLRHSGT